MKKLKVHLLILLKSRILLNYLIQLRDHVEHFVISSELYLDTHFIPFSFYKFVIDIAVAGITWLCLADLYDFFHYSFQYEHLQKHSPHLSVEVLRQNY